VRLAWQDGAVSMGRRVMRRLTWQDRSIMVRRCSVRLAWQNGAVSMGRRVMRRLTWQDRSIMVSRSRRSTKNMRSRSSRRRPRDMRTRRSRSVRRRVRRASQPGRVVLVVAGQMRVVVADGSSAGDTAGTMFRGGVVVSACREASWHGRWVVSAGVGSWQT
jgi:hypothetical protein